MTLWLLEALDFGDYSTRWVVGFMNVFAMTSVVRRKDVLIMMSRCVKVPQAMIKIRSHLLQYTYRDFLYHAALASLFVSKLGCFD